MNNAARAAFGNAAIKAGTPDFGQNGNDFDGALTDAGDAICNMLHALYARALSEGRDVEDVLLALQKGEGHFTAEAVEPDDITMGFIDSDNDLSYAQAADLLPPRPRVTTLTIRDPDYENEQHAEVVGDVEVEHIEVDLGSQFNGPKDFDPAADWAQEWLADMRAQVAHLPISSEIRQHVESLCDELERRGGS